VISAANSMSSVLDAWFRCFLGTLTFDGESVAWLENFVGLAGFCDSVLINVYHWTLLELTLPSNANGVFGPSP